MSITSFGSATVPARITPQEKARKSTNNLVIKIELAELFYFPFHFPHSPLPLCNPFFLPAVYFLLVVFRVRDFMCESYLSSRYYIRKLLCGYYVIIM